MEKLYIPGRYSREFHSEQEAMRRGETIPRVQFYDPTDKYDKKRLTQDLKAATGKRIILPLSVFSERVKRRAERQGIYRNTIEIFSRDILKLDGYSENDDEFQEQLQQRDNPENYLIVRYPWLNAFVTVPHHDEFRRITQSREYGITSEKAQTGLAKDHFLVVGGGVGGRIAVSLAGAGAEHVTLIDASPISPHRGSRSSGPFLPQIGENQAIYYVKQMLELNPYGEYTAIPQYIGDPSKTQNVADMDALIDWSNFIFQEIDQLEMKGEIHMRAQSKRKLCAQITDAGTGTIILLDDPKFQLPPFNGRLTPEVHAAMQQMDPDDKDAFLYKAVEVYMGYANISPHFEHALHISKNAGFKHIPQSGRAASKAGAEAVNLYCEYADGKITGPVERLVA